MKQNKLMFLITKRNVLGKRGKGSPIPQPNRKIVGTHTTASFFEWSSELNVSTKFKKDVAVYLG